MYIQVFKWPVKIKNRKLTDLVSLNLNSHYNTRYESMKQISTVKKKTEYFHITINVNMDLFNLFKNY